MDSLGYYAVLGLDAKRRRSVRAEDVKSAFRKSALVSSPALSLSEGIPLMCVVGGGGNVGVGL